MPFNVQRAYSLKDQPHTAKANAPSQQVNIVGALDYASREVGYDVHLSGATQLSY